MHRSTFSYQLFSGILMAYSQPYLGEIRLFGGEFEPRDWRFCNGQLLPIAGNDTLFMLIGPTYGGDGQTTFALPDLRSRVPIHMGQGPGLSNYSLGQTGGDEVYTLTVANVPGHSHAFTFLPIASTNSGTTGNPANAYFAASGVKKFYGNQSQGAMTSFNRSNAGQATEAAGGRNFPNSFSMIKPVLALNFIICVSGIYPTT